MPRFAAGANLTLASGTMLLAYFTARGVQTVTSVMMAAGTTIHPALTLGKMALFRWTAGDLTLLQGPQVTRHCSDRQRPQHQDDLVDNLVAGGNAMRSAS